MSNSSESFIPSEQAQDRQSSEEGGEKINHCSSCGYPVSSDARFCESCGLDFATGETFAARQKIEKREELVKTARKVIGGFFTSLDGTNRGEVQIDLGEDFRTAKVKVMVRSGDKDQVKFPDDFAIGFEAQAYLTKVKEQKTFCLQCDLVEFTFGDKKIKLRDFCPADVNFYIGGDRHCYRYTIGPKGVINKKIFLEQLASPEDFIALLHEVGHVLSDAKLDVTDLQDRGSGLAARERSAWAEGIKIARKNDLPVEKETRMVAQYYLDTYQQADEEDMPGYAVGFTNKKKKEIRGKINDYLNNKCSNCGHSVESGSQFCSNCGKDLILG